MAGGRDGSGETRWERTLVQRQGSWEGGASLKQSSRKNRIYTKNRVSALEAFGFPWGRNTVKEKDFKGEIRHCPEADRLTAAWLVV